MVISEAGTCGEFKPNHILPGTRRITTHQGAQGPIKAGRAFPVCSTSDVYSFAYLLHVSIHGTQGSSSRSLPPSANELSFKINEDPNGGDGTGFMNISRAVDGSKGTCQHSGVTYLEETSGRNNISVLLGARATRIAFLDVNGELTATGVEYEANGAKLIVNATKQVVLSAGNTYSLPFNEE